MCRNDVNINLQDPHVIRTMSLLSPCLFSLYLSMALGDASSPSTMARDMRGQWGLRRMVGCDFSVDDMWT
jgi:hypothetical protein